ncbi:MAG: dual specificity protein phosphatase family protein [Candidatus Thorarchaeota archaeon]
MAELDQIYRIDDNLYIGAYWPRLNFEKFKELGITAIVNLMEENLYNPTSQGFTYLHKGFPDDWYPPHSFIKEILEFIDINIREGKVFVHCSMGISRSGGIVVAWLMKVHPNWSWKDALSYVNQSRLVYPAREIKQSILDYFESIEGKRREI